MSGRRPQRPAPPTSQDLLDALPGTAAVLDHDGRVIAVNDAWRRLGGHDGTSPVVAALGESYVDVCEHAAAAGSWEGTRLGAALRSVLRGATTTFRSTCSSPHTSREATRWFSVRLAAVGTGPVRVLVTQEDVTDRERMVHALELRASEDPLTGLGNRLVLAVGLTVALARGPRTAGHAGVGLVYLDLDDFKPVNDTHGHAVGDAVLRSVARRLTALSRPGDTVARLGGDEFAMCLPGLSPHDLVGLTRRVVDALERPHAVGDVALAVPASVGSHLAAPGDDVEVSLDCADLAMYVEKRRRHRTGRPG